MTELERLVQRCKCEVEVTFNEHKNDYQSVQEWLDYPRGEGTTREHLALEPEAVDRMIALDRTVTLRFYPNTPIGFFVMGGTDLDELLARAHRALDEGK